MNLISLDIPTDPEQLPSWLEQLLVGLELPDFIEQWEAILGIVPGPGPELNTILGDQRASLLREGLSVLSSSQVRQFLKHPRLLTQLQEIVLTEGEGFWSNVPISTEHQKLVNDVWERVQEKGFESIKKKERSVKTERSATSPHRSVRWIGVLVAVLLVSAGLFLLRPVPGPAWGPGRLAQVPADATPKVYMNTFADMANQWTKKTPINGDELKQRLKVFRDGCDSAAKLPHTQLAAVDRVFIQKQCRDCRDAIDLRLKELSEGQDFQTVLKQANLDVQSLVDALRKRSTQLS